eukprot:gene10259-biopygen9321
MQNRMDALYTRKWKKGGCKWEEKEKGLGRKGRTSPRGNRTLARAWRGHGAGVARAIGMFWLGVARAWRGHGAGTSRSPRIQGQ